MSERVAINNSMCAPWLNQSANSWPQQNIDYPPTPYPFPDVTPSKEPWPDLQRHSTGLDRLVHDNSAFDPFREHPTVYGIRSEKYTQICVPPNSGFGFGSDGIQNHSHHTEACIASTRQTTQSCAIGYNINAPTSQYVGISDYLTDVTAPRIAPFAYEKPYRDQFGYPLSANRIGVSQTVPQVESVRGPITNNNYDSYFSPEEARMLADYLNQGVEERNLPLVINPSTNLPIVPTHDDVVICPLPAHRSSKIPAKGYLDPLDVGLDLSSNRSNSANNGVSWPIRGNFNPLDVGLDLSLNRSNSAITGASWLPCQQVENYELRKLHQTLSSPEIVTIEDSEDSTNEETINISQSISLSSQSFIENNSSENQCKGSGNLDVNTEGCKHYSQSGARNGKETLKRKSYEVIQNNRVDKTIETEKYQTSLQGSAKIVPFKKDEQSSNDISFSDDVISTKKNMKKRVKRIKKKAKLPEDSIHLNHNDRLGRVVNISEKSLQVVAKIVAERNEESSEVSSDESLDKNFKRVRTVKVNQSKDSRIDEKSSNDISYSDDVFHKKTFKNIKKKTKHSEGSKSINNDYHLDNVVKTSEKALQVVVNIVAERNDVSSDASSDDGFCKRNFKRILTMKDMKGKYISPLKKKHSEKADLKPCLGNVKRLPQKAIREFKRESRTEGKSSNDKDLALKKENGSKKYSPVAIKRDVISKVPYHESQDEHRKKSLSKVRKRKLPEKLAPPGEETTVFPTDRQITSERNEYSKLPVPVPSFFIEETLDLINNRKPISNDDTSTSLRNFLQDSCRPTSCTSTTSESTVSYDFSSAIVVQVTKENNVQDFIDNKQGVSSFQTCEETAVEETFYKEIVKIIHKGKKEERMGIGPLNLNPRESDLKKLVKPCVVIVKRLNTKDIKRFQHGADFSRKKKETHLERVRSSKLKPRSKKNSPKKSLVVKKKGNLSHHEKYNSKLVSGSDSPPNGQPLGQELDETTCKSTNSSIKDEVQPSGSNTHQETTTVNSTPIDVGKTNISKKKLGSKLANHMKPKDGIKPPSVVNSQDNGSGSKLKKRFQTCLVKLTKSLKRDDFKAKEKLSSTSDSCKIINSRGSPTRDSCSTPIGKLVLCKESTPIKSRVISTRSLESKEIQVKKSETESSQSEAIVIEKRRDCSLKVLPKMFSGCAEKTTKSAITSIMPQSAKFLKDKTSVDHRTNSNSSKKSDSKCGVLEKVTIAKKNYKPRKETVKLRSSFSLIQAVPKDVASSKNSTDHKPVSRSSESSAAKESTLNKHIDGIRRDLILPKVKVCEEPVQYKSKTSLDSNSHSKSRQKNNNTKKSTIKEEKLPIDSSLSKPEQIIEGFLGLSQSTIQHFKKEKVLDGSNSQKNKSNTEIVRKEKLSVLKKISGKPTQGKESNVIERKTSHSEIIKNNSFEFSTTIPKQEIPTYAVKLRSANKPETSLHSKTNSNVNHNNARFSDSNDSHLIGGGILEASNKTESKNRQVSVNIAIGKLTVPDQTLLKGNKIVCAVSNKQIKISEAEDQNGFSEILLSNETISVFKNILGSVNQINNEQKRESLSEEIETFIKEPKEPLFQEAYPRIQEMEPTQSLMQSEERNQMLKEGMTPEQMHHVSLALKVVQGKSDNPHEECHWFKPIQFKTSPSYKGKFLQDTDCSEHASGCVHDPRLCTCNQNKMNFTPQMSNPENVSEPSCDPSKYWKEEPGTKSVGLSLPKVSLENTGTFSKDTDCSKHPSECVHDPRLFRMCHQNLTSQRSNPESDILSSCDTPKYWKVKPDAQTVSQSLPNVSLECTTNLSVTEVVNSKPAIESFDTIVSTMDVHGSDPTMISKEEQSLALKNPTSEKEELMQKETTETLKEPEINDFENYPTAVNELVDISLSTNEIDFCLTFNDNDQCSLQELNVPENEIKNHPINSDNDKCIQESITNVEVPSELTFIQDNICLSKETNIPNSNKVVEALQNTRSTGLSLIQDYRDETSLQLENNEYVDKREYYSFGLSSILEYQDETVHSQNNEHEFKSQIRTLDVGEKQVKDIASNGEQSGTESSQPNELCNTCVSEVPKSQDFLHLDTNLSFETNLLELLNDDHHTCTTISSDNCNGESIANISLSDSISIQDNQVCFAEETNSPHSKEEILEHTTQPVKIQCIVSSDRILHVTKQENVIPELSLLHEEETVLPQVNEPLLNSSAQTQTFDLRAKQSIGVTTNGNKTVTEGNRSSELGNTCRSQIFESLEVESRESIDSVNNLRTGTDLSGAEVEGVTSNGIKTAIRNTPSDELLNNFSFQIPKGLEEESQNSQESVNNVLEEVNVGQKSTEDSLIDGLLKISQTPQAQSLVTGNQDSFGSISKRIEIVYVEEEDDIRNADWDEYKVLNTDLQRYNTVRLKWGSKEAPNPNRNLTVQNYRRLRIKKSRHGKRSRKRRRKEVSLSPQQPIKRPRVAPSTFLQEMDLEDNRKAYAKDIQQLKNYTSRCLDQLQCAHERRCLDINNGLGFFRQNNETMYSQTRLYARRDGIYQQLKVGIYDIKKQFYSSCEQLHKKYLSKHYKLLKCWEEVHRVNSFYVGLQNDADDPTMFTEDQVKEFSAVNDMLNKLQRHI